MKYFLAPFLATFLAPLLLLTSLAWAADVPVAGPAAARVAKVEMSELHEDFLDLVLAKPENAAIKKQKETAEANDLKRNAAMQVAHAAGKAGKELEVVMAEFPQNDYQYQQRLERLVRTEVLRIIAKKYGTRFTVVLDGDNASVIYLEGEIVDLTQTLKQALQLNDF